MSEASDKFAQLYILSPPERLFNDVMGRCYDRFRFVLSFRITAKASMEAAKEKIEADKITYVANVLTDPEYEKMFINKAKFLEDNPPDKIVAEMTAQTIAEMELMMNAASLVFVHSVLDAAALDFCRVTAMAAPKDWESVVEKKGVSLEEAKAANYDQLLERKLKDYFVQLERESLLTKADLLLARCKPPAKWNPMTNYEYDKKRLEYLDQFRHNIIHGDGMGMELKSADDEIDYLMKTAHYFMGLVNLRYGFRLAPLYMFQVMAEFSKPTS